jgi:putative SOS response-associated peptidase YedK
MLRERFGAKWLVDRPMDNRFNPVELFPKARAWVLRNDDRGLGIDVMSWDVLGGAAKWPMTNVRQLGLPQWRRLAASPENRCLIPLTEFAEWTPEKDAEHGIKGEMWFHVTDQPTFAVAGFWQAIGDYRGFAMVTCEPNELVAPIHPKAMITILAESDWELWLNGSYDDVVSLQRPYPASDMAVRGPVFLTRGKAAKA